MLQPGNSKVRHQVISRHQGSQEAQKILRPCGPLYRSTRPKHDHYRIHSCACAGHDLRKLRQGRAPRAQKGSGKTRAKLGNAVPAVGTSVPKADKTCTNLGNALSSLGMSEPDFRSRWPLFRPPQPIKTIEIGKLRRLLIWPILHFSP